LGPASMKEGTLKFPTTCEAPHAAGGLGGPLSKRRLPGYLPANPAGARLQCPYGLHAPSSPGYRAPLSLGSAWTRLRQPGPTHARGLPFQGSTLLGQPPPPPPLQFFMLRSPLFSIMYGPFIWTCGPLSVASTDNVRHRECSSSNMPMA
jgi:hypothetical protein